MNTFFNGLNFIEFETQLREDLKTIISTLYPEVPDDIIYNLYKKKPLFQGSSTSGIGLNWDTEKYRYNEDKEETSWLFESTITSAFGEIAVKRGNYELKRALSGTYLKSSLAPSSMLSKEEIEVKWVLNDNEKDGSFYHFYGKTLPDEFIANDRHVRFYFHLKCISEEDIKSIKNIIKAIVYELDRRRVPFDIKIVNYSDKMFADAAVLYLEQRYFTTVAGFLIQLSKKNERFFNETVPMFTYKLSKGLGFAESIERTKGEEESFGKQRSKILGEIFRQYSFPNKPDAAQIIKDINNYGEKLTNGRNKEWSKSFFLNPLSSYKYSFLKGEDDEFSLYKYIDNKHLYLATSIGYRICKEAIWTDGQYCNWIRRSMKGGRDFYENLDEYYLDGIAGTLLFLSKLYSESKLKIFKQHSVGAVSSLIAILSDSSYQFKHGFHKGSLGTLWVLYEINYNLKLELKDELDILLNNFIESINNDLDTTKECSLFFGTAGTLFGLVNISNFYKENQSQFEEIKLVLSNLANKIESLQSNDIEVIINYNGKDFTFKNLFLWKSTIDYKRSYDVYPLGFGNGSAGIVSAIAYYQKTFKIEEYDDVIENAFASEVACEETRIEKSKIYIRPDFAKKDIYAWVNTSLEAGQNGVYLSILLLSHLEYKNKKSKITEVFLKKIYDQFDKIIDKNEAIITHDVNNTLENTETGYFDIIVEIAKEYDKPIYQWFDKFDSINDKVLGGSYYPKDRNGEEYFSPGLQGLAGIGYCYLRMMMKSKLPTYHFPMYEVQTKSAIQKIGKFVSKNSPFRLASRLLR